MKKKSLKSNHKKAIYRKEPLKLFIKINEGSKNIKQDIHLKEIIKF